MIWSDMRGDQGGAFQALAVEWFADDIGFTILDSADFLIADQDGHTAGIERKTYADLLASVADGRLSAQLGRLVETYTHPIIVLEGTYRLRADGKTTVGGRDTKFTHASWQAVLMDMQRRTKITVMPSSSREATLDIVRMIHNRALKGCVEGRK